MTTMLLYIRWLCMYMNGASMIMTLIQKVIINAKNMEYYNNAEYQEEERRVDKKCGGWKCFPAKLLYKIAN